MKNVVGAISVAALVAIALPVWAQPPNQPSAAQNPPPMQQQPLPDQGQPSARTQRPPAEAQPEASMQRPVRSQTARPTSRWRYGYRTHRTWRAQYTPYRAYGDPAYGWQARQRWYRPYCS
jgi:hypothetical protein